MRDIPFCKTETPVGRVGAAAYAAGGGALILTAAESGRG
jgi:hypothetical protein